ncbi:hypothetical protein [Alkalicoccus saliphilus]|jgi:transposase|uniref:Transposase n=1 Tax=Alkalicoccus saliphilus TaxID=200989 RepID=A0A2T4U4U5_9BACI|nr:hypothetical protein [Alkalicoccus saliphilus]PTL38414.1 hypothetical protein C6Y45_11695 [Alkalicoccus saliphilus]
MGDKEGAIEELKKKYVRRALESGNIGTTAKSAGICRTTMRAWINKYENQIVEEMDREILPMEEGPLSRQELEKRYEQALKLLGEKELEVAVLRDLFEKKSRR